MPKYSYRVRREYLELSGERQEELIEATKRMWWSRIIAIYAAAVILPVVLPVGLILGIRTLFSPVPVTVRWLLAGCAVLAMYFGPKLILRLAGNVTFKSMQSACLQLFAKQRLRAG